MWKYEETATSSSSLDPKVILLLIFAGDFQLNADDLALSGSSENIHPKLNIRGVGYILYLLFRFFIFFVFWIL